MVSYGVILLLYLRKLDNHKDFSYERYPKNPMRTYAREEKSVLRDLDHDVATLLQL